VVIVEQALELFDSGELLAYCCVISRLNMPHLQFQIRCQKDVQQRGLDYHDVLIRHYITLLSVVFAMGV
jgi:hypothetical protein